MYHSYSADDYRQHYELAPDYTVDGLVGFGTMPHKRQWQIAHETIGALNLQAVPVLESGFLESVHAIEVQGRRVWFVITFGGAFLSSVVQLACLFGSKANLLVGSCGGLQKGRRMGDILLAETSYGDESTTRMYHRDNTTHVYHADPGLLSRLESRLISDYVVQRSKLVTCQAFHAETWEDVVSWSAQGFDGVEMESSTLFAVSNHFAAPCAAAVYIVDNLIEQESLMDMHVRERREELRHMRHDLLKAAILEAAAAGQPLA